MTTEALQNLKSLKTFLKPKGSEQAGDVAKNKAAFSNHLHANKAAIEQGRRTPARDIDQLRDQNPRKDLSQDDKISRQERYREREQQQTDKASAEQYNDAHVEESNQRTDVEAKDNEHLEGQDDTNAQGETLETQDTFEQTKDQSEQDVLQDKETQTLTSTEDGLVLETDPLLEEGEETVATNLQEEGEKSELLAAIQGTATKSEGLFGQKETSELAVKQGALSLDQKGGGKGGLLGQGAGLESTLGQDEDGEISINKSSVIEKGNNEIAKSFSQVLSNKDARGAAHTQQPAGPILASNPLTSSPLAKTNTFQPVRQDAGVVQSGDGTSSSLALQTQETKGASPTNALRSAGYTSPTQSIALTIAQKAQNGIQQFEIRLNPPELGRVDVRLEFGREGTVTTHLIVERPETLEMLNKDGRQLERALADAGVNIDNDGLSFSLKDQQDGQEPEDDLLSQEFDGQAALDEPSDDQSATQAYHRITLPGGLDIRI